MEVIILAVVLLVAVVAIVLKTRQKDYDPDKMIAKNNAERMKSRYK